MMNTSASGGFSKLVLTNFIFGQSGTYQNQIGRGFNMSASVNAVSKLQSAMEGMQTTRVTEGLLSSYAPDFMSVQSTGAPIVIPQGWGERRGIFILSFRGTTSTGSVKDYVIQGYTNYYGVSHSGALDPNMEFFINNVVALDPFTTRVGAVDMPSARLRAAYQPIYDHSLVNGGEGYMSRPRDVTVSIANQGLVPSGNIENNSAIVNMRRASTSNRLNNVPISYAANILNAIGQAATMPSDPMVKSYGNDSNVSVVAEGAIGNLAEVGEQDMFLRFLGHVVANRSSGISMCFYHNLLKLFPNIEAVGTKLRSNAATMQMSTTSNADHWMGRGLDTKAAMQMATAIPALLLESMGHNAVFQISNLMGSTPAIKILSFGCVHDSLMSTAANKFQNLLLSHLVSQVTLNNDVVFDALIEVNIYSEIIIQLKIADYPPTRFVAPAFCDSLMTPVYTRDKEQVNNFTNVMTRAFNEIAEATRSVDGMRAHQAGLQVLNQAVSKPRDFSGHFDLPASVSTGGGSVPFPNQPNSLAGMISGQPTPQAPVSGTHSLRDMMG